MKAIILGNGTVINTSNILNYIDENTILICCDGGIRHAFKEGLIPNYIIGDLDSSKAPILNFFKEKGVIFKKFKCEKDETDMEICIQFCIDNNIDDITIFGATGTRLDHTMTNLHLLKMALNHKILSKIIDDNNEIYMIDNEIEIDGKVGDLISLVPISTEVKGVCTVGLSYSLKNCTMKIDKSLGVSNIMKYEKCKVSIKSGYLMVFKSKD